MAGGAADGIDAGMAALSFVPGANLASDTYFGLKGAKALGEGNYTEAALDMLPFGSAAVTKGMPYIMTGLRNLSNKFSSVLDRAS
jgi:hypothetical protein